MNSQTISVAYSAFTNKGAFALLLGSGISRKSGIPTGWDITLNLISQIALLEKQDPGTDLEKWYLDYFSKEADYSDILEKLTNTQEERLNLLRPFIEPSAEELEEGLKTPTVAHKQIARLVKEGYIKVIITTNFDRLIENALKELGIEPTVISNPEHIENSIPLIHSNITIIKINGDYLDTTFLNIKSELENYDNRLVNIIKFIFENFGLITCGWSAKWDIALVDILKAANKFRYSNYFTYLNRIDEEFKELSTFRQGQLVKIKDADSFFTELAENIESLEKNNDNHPLTSQVALQRIKKYLAKEEHTISLHDLLYNITDDFLSKLQSINLAVVPSIETMKEVRDQYINKSDLMVLSFATISYWAKPHHYNTVVNTLKRIASAAEGMHTTSSPAWGTMVYLPVLILRYTCGISCVASGDFKLLYLMSTMQVKTRYKLEPFVKISDAQTVIERDHLNKMEGANYYLPMSEFIFKYLRPYFKNLIPIDSDYELFFDYYEFINAINYIKYSEHGWYPMGRFAYKNGNIADDILKKAETEKSNFELIKSGFFDSYDDLKQDFNKFSEYFKTVRHHYW